MQTSLNVIRHRIVGAVGVLALMLGACAPRYSIKSYPEGATVFVKDVVTQEKKLVGQTPLQLKRTKEMGDVFFLSVEKDNFHPKQILLTPKEGENLTITLALEPLADAKDGTGKEGDGQQPTPPEDKKKQEDLLKDLNLRIALLENTVALQKEALFSGRYSNGGPARFDRDRQDSVVDNLFKAQQLVMQKKYQEAMAEVDKAILSDEYSPQAHLVKGTIFYVTKQFQQAKLAWERSLKIDPYNANAYQYLRLVNRKLGVQAPPERPSMLRAPATDAFSRGLRE